MGGASQPALLVTNAEVGTNGDGVSDDLERNVIAGNYGVGIDITEGYVAGNYIGVDASGTKTLGNRLAGVVVKGDGVRIGSNADSVNDDVEGNVVGGNGVAGIAIEGTSATVLGNWIGTDSSSRFSLGNRGSGIQIGSSSLTSGVQGHTIGRTVAQPPTLENTIAFNAQAGVRVVGNNANNSVGINRYLGSGTLAIDAGNVGVTLNPTTTATTQQDFPILTDAYIDGDEVVVRGFVRPGVTTDFYLAGPNALKFGDGIEHLYRAVEGSAADSDATVGTYDNSTLSGLNIATGAITTNRFEYRFARPENLQYGSRLTAVHVGAVGETVKLSEFSNSIYVGDATGFTVPGSSLPAVVTLPGLQTVQQGEELRIQGSFTDYDSTEWTARIAFGDGTSQSVSLREDFTFEVVHTYANPGNYAVTMTVTDNALAQGFASMPVVVQNSAPEIDLNLVEIIGPVNEGTSVQLRGAFQDARNTEEHDVTIQWGDGTTSSLFIAPGQTEFTASHLYSSRGAASVLGAGVDLYQVRVSISDPSSAADSTPVGLLTAEVRNVLPSNLVTNFSASSIQVGQTLTLTSGSFSDPGLQDLHRVRVDWGDGSESIVNLGPGVMTFGNISHTYTSTPRFGTEYEVTVELIDLDQPLQSLRSTRLIEVTSAVISNISLVTNTSSLNEGELLVLGGSFTTATPSQRHRVRVNWGDGSAPTTVYLAPGSTAFGGVLHQYADDSHGTTGFEVTVEIANLDSPDVSGSSSAIVVVQNVAPIVGSFELDNLGSNATNQEGDTLRLTGLVADDGIEDRHSITIDWGDGSPLTQATVNSQTGEFEAIHRFIDQSSAITVSASDDDGAITTRTLNPAMINIAPRVAIVPSATNVNPNLIELLSQVDDVLGDTNFSYSWSAFPVGVPSVPVQSGSGANLVIDRTLAPTAIWNVALTVSDNEGGSATHELSLLAGTAGNDQLTVDNSTIAGLTTDRLLVLGLGGSDVLDGSGMTDPSFQLILDGGAGTDQLYGGAGNDQFYLRQGNDSANVPIGGVNLANAMAGSDRYYLVPNSTLTVYDSTGANALDFGLASFGITFDLSMNLSSTLTTQDVDPTGATGQHFVATQGAFAELVGGNFNDTLTAASNSSVYAGAGNDRLKVGSNTTGATFYGGADDDYLIASGLAISDLSFQGDDGIDALENLGTIESLVFSGGADDDYLVNRGTVLGELSFGGDDGVDYLENIAAIASLVFSGGADDDYLINRGALETLSFGGDDGADFLENVALASIGSLVFTGGADDDYLINRGALETLSFGGDDGLDSLENLGVIAELVFTGGADDDSLINRGALETLSFGGDDGADFLENVALATIGTLVFTGGADDDYLVNRGVVLSELSFGGDDGLDSLENLGAIAELVFTGGADDDSLINRGVLQVLTFEGGADDDSLLNLSDATISSISFQGDDGIDSLENLAAISHLVFNGGADDDYLLNVSGTITEISFNGDDGEDFLRNEATILGTLVFTGGADDDYLLNLGVLESLSFGGDDGDDYLLNIGAMESIVFTGGADDDYLINRGTVLEELSFSGDDGIDSLINSGAVETLVFTGGADDDYLLNTVSAVVDSISFQGDDGEDLLRNESVLESIVFTGGADDDALVNLASVAEITFSGGADDDYLLNQASEVTSISFNGDDGIDNLVNLGSAISTLVFRGGADDDYLLNQGDAISQLVFEGGADDDTLVSRGVHTGTISFLGDDLLSGIQGNDVFILHGSGTASGTVSFSGLGARDLLQNNATGLGSIEFVGGADDDVLQNSGDAVLSISFQGDDGADILDNSGSRVLSLQFTGGADEDYLLNEGTAVASITFSGGADDDYLINVGDAVASISFGGDDGEDVLVNRGAAVANVVFTGGADNDTLINDGLKATGVTFHGGSGSDRFLNRLAGAGSTGLEFIGDDGEDFLVNQAIDVGTISFHGGADDDSLLNYGTAVQSISFVGDDGIDTLLNSGDAVSDIVFNGGSDDDVLLNLGEAVGSISFQGDDGADLLQNSGASVSAITFSGGADDDVLINNGEAVTTISFGGDDGEDILQNNAAAVGEITFNGGADHDVLQNNGNQVSFINFMGGDGNDKLLNNGDDTNEMFFGGGDGADTLLHKGRGLSELLFEGGQGTDVLRVTGFDVGIVTFDGGDDADSMVYEASRTVGGSSSSVVFNGAEGNDLLAWLGTGPVSLLADGGLGDDTFAIGGEGQLNLIGGIGNDYFVFQGSPLAQVQIDETSVATNDDSVDTLDFSTFADGPLNLDLRTLDEQSQGAALSITLTDSAGIENVFGTHRGDTILGNARNNVISGAEFIEPEVLPIAPRRAAPQWVYLDFDSKTQPALGEHVYSQSERDAIQAGIESVYHGPDADPNDPSSWWFKVRFTQNLADLVTVFGVSHASELPQDRFVTILFNETPSFGRPGGEASEIDMGNLNLGGTAVVQLTGMLGGQLSPSDLGASSTDPLGDNVEGDIKIGARKPVANSENFVALSVKIAAHELGHLLGLRHHDTFGPVGFGIHTTPGPAEYSPAYTGPAGAFEAVNHLLGSGASIGTDRFNDLRQLFFGEREAVKLVYAMSDFAAVTSQEQSGLNQSLGTAQQLSFIGLDVPNTLRSGLNAGKTFDVKIASVLGGNRTW